MGPLFPVCASPPVSYSLTCYPFPLTYPKGVLVLPSVCLCLCTLMFRLTQPNCSCFVSLSTPGSGVKADPLAVVLCPGSSILSSGLSRGLRVVAGPVSAVLPGSRHAASLMAPTGLLLTSSWIHLLIIDTC